MSSVKTVLRLLRRHNVELIDLKVTLKKYSDGEGVLPERFQLVRARVECAQQELNSAIKLLELPLL